MRMAEIEQLKAQAQRCRTLAGGLSNQQDVRTLEALASELEARARAAARKHRMKMLPLS